MSNYCSGFTCTVSSCCDWGFSDPSTHWVDEDATACYAHYASCNPLSSTPDKTVYSTAYPVFGISNTQTHSVGVPLAPHPVPVTGDAAPHPVPLAIRPVLGDGKQVFFRVRWKLLPTVRCGTKHMAAFDWHGCQS